jgi:hypothetical protein
MADSNLAIPSCGSVNKIAATLVNNNSTIFAMEKTRNMANNLSLRDSYEYDNQMTINLPIIPLQHKSINGKSYRMHRHSSIHHSRKASQRASSNKAEDDVTRKSICIDGIEGTSLFCTSF